MRRGQSAQALVEWALSAFVLLLFCFGFLAVGEIVYEYQAVRTAADQAAFAAARAPSAQAAQDNAQRAAAEAVAGSRVSNFALTLDTQGFARGATVTATATGCVNVAYFPFALRLFGACPQVQWSAHALIEPYRSRSG